MLSEPGDRVPVHAGTYNQSVVIANKNGITLTSAGDGEAIIAGNGSASTQYLCRKFRSTITISGLNDQEYPKNRPGLYRYYRYWVRQ